MSGRRICLVGDISGNIDEGMKKVTYNIYKGLSQNNEVIVVKPLELIRNKMKINEFNPDIIHYITGPSIFSFFLLKIGGFGLKNVKSVVSISHPQKLFPPYFISLLRPNMAIVQSDDMNTFFSNLGINTVKICNGIDLKSFSPVNSRQKLYLRSKYGIADDKFVILHVGNIRDGRNLYPLIKLAKTREFQVVVVASTTIKKDIKLYNPTFRTNFGPSSKYQTARSLYFPEKPLLCPPLLISSKDPTSRSAISGSSPVLSTPSGSPRSLTVPFPKHGTTTSPTGILSKPWCSTVLVLSSGGSTCIRRFSRTSPSTGSWATV